MYSIDLFTRDSATPQPAHAMIAPNLPLLPEVLLGPQPGDQPSFKLAAEGVQRYVWQSAYGAMLIEVRDGIAFVNGDRVTSLHELRTL